MRRHLTLGLLLVAGVAGLWALKAAGGAEEKKGPMVIHNVYFTLEDNSPAAKAKLVAACDKYLKGHPGTAYYGAGVRAEKLDREINDKDFDVALNLVFEDMAAHDRYQEDERHKQFIEENRANWKKVRVFDALAGE